MGLILKLTKRQFSGILKVREREEKKNRSCLICGFFVEREALTVGNRGYCTYYDELDEKGKPTGESMKIPDGEEKYIAGRCQGYFRTVRDMTLGEFVNWRVGIQTFRIEKDCDRWAQIIAVSAVIVAICHILVTMGIGG